MTGQAKDLIMPLTKSDSAERSPHFQFLSTDTVVFTQTIMIAPLAWVIPICQWTRTTKGHFTC